MDSYTIDTNVLVVSNGGTPQATYKNQLDCIEFLEKLVLQKEKISIDDLGLILNEYMGYANHSGQPGAGDIFFRYLHDHQAMENICEKVTITPGGDKNVAFEELLTFHEQLTGFDREDQKFLAVAKQSQYNCHICNATDTDWRQFEPQIKAMGIDIIFLCPNLA